MFTRIAVVNRGEAARRLIHAVRELNAERPPAEGGALLQTIALYTEAERHAPFVLEADLVYCLGPASARPYLDLARPARTRPGQAGASLPRTRRSPSCATGLG
jgi:acetyl/propionyl-CoA carboxylase alpha subunit